MLFRKNKNKEETKKLQQELKKAEQSLDTQNTILQKKLKEDAPTISWQSKLKQSLYKTRRQLIPAAFSSSSNQDIDDAFLEELEECLLLADMGAPTALQLIDAIDKEKTNGSLKTKQEAIDYLRKRIAHIFNTVQKPLPEASEGVSIYLFIGINGAGKTTSIGKLAHHFKQQGKKVLVAAGDTFRAAAAEQLQIWSERAGIDIVTKESGFDPSALLYIATEKAVTEKYDVLLCDTSGRLHTKQNLMDELQKMKRSIAKVLPNAPHATLLILDANGGQNGIAQTKGFYDQIGLEGLVITKLDGTAKGGVLIGIVNEFEIPIYFIGIGEKLDDLQAFQTDDFVDALLAPMEQEETDELSET